MIDYIIKETGAPKIHYVGFSQGTTAFWVMTSTRPQYNDKIIGMQAMAPIAYLTHIKSPVMKLISPFTKAVDVRIPIFCTLS
jgi:pimeloyl-ACP methyl ester carboxylesterase